MNCREYQWLISRALDSAEGLEDLPFEHLLTCRECADFLHSCEQMAVALAGEPLPVEERTALQPVQDTAPYPRPYRPQPPRGTRRSGWRAESWPWALAGTVALLFLALAIGGRATTEERSLSPTASSRGDGEAVQVAAGNHDAAGDVREAMSPDRAVAESALPPGETSDPMSALAPRGAWAWIGGPVVAMSEPIRRPLANQIDRAGERLADVGKTMLASVPLPASQYNAQGEPAATSP